MKVSSLTSISPVDGRYFKQTEKLSPFFSEFGLMYYRVKVEIAYFIKLHSLGLTALPILDQKAIDALNSIVVNFSLEDARAIKKIEKTTNHDVKAVEYFIKEKLTDPKWQKSIEFIHFGLTSQDINNTAIPWALKDFLNADEGLFQMLDSLINAISIHAENWKDVSMLARTHGQPASPTKLGKELDVFVTRMQKQVALLKMVEHTGKFGGATGNMNAHFVAFPNVDWHLFAKELLADFGLKRSFPTTQIEHYDALATLFDNIKRINIILIDFCRDMWQYISMDYFKQTIKKDEVGSSAMPHKVNPIDFENAEGNLGMANAVFEFLSAKLPISRLQRDLTDSTVLRNVGIPLAHTHIALASIQKGIKKIVLNKEALDSDLEKNWAVVAEALQTILRRESYPKPYEKLKELTRTNERITASSIATFIENLDVDDRIKKEMMGVNPFNYVGK